MVAHGRRKGEMTFIYNCLPGAKRVFLVGDFNEWSPEDKRMSRHKDGTFRARVSLAAGNYQYKFLADGRWVNDPDAHGQVTNAFGTTNSVVHVP